MNVSNSSKSVVAAADDVMMQDSDDASIQWAEGYSMLCEDEHHNDVDHGVDHLVNSMFGSSNDGHGMSDTLYNFESPISSLDTSLMHTPGLSPVSLGDNAHDSDLSRASFSGHKKQLSVCGVTDYCYTECLPSSTATLAYFIGRQRCPQYHVSRRFSNAPFLLQKRNADHVPINPLEQHSTSASN